MKGSMLGKVFTAVVLLVFAGAYLLPVYWMLVTAVRPIAEFYEFPPSLIPRDITFEAFRSVLVQRDFKMLLWNSLMVCTGAVVLALVVSMFLVYPLTRMEVPACVRQGLLNWILSLRFLPPIVVVIPWFSMVRTIGLYDQRISLVLLYTIFSLPLGTWMLRSFLLEVPREVEEAAWVDGASRIRAFFSVVLPQVAPAVLAVAVISFALMWSEFMFAFVLTATPRSQTFPIGVASLVTQFQIIWNEMAAAGTIAALVPIILLLLMRRYVLTALTLGAIREKS